MGNAAYYINYLKLKPHPEGGYYAETYRSEGVIPVTALHNFAGSRPYATAIYYLLQQGDFSAFHRIKSDECWHFYAGDVIYIHVLYDTGEHKKIRLGAAIDKNEVLQFVVPANTWFAAECAEKSSFVLSGCTVAPGFDFADFEMADSHQLIKEFPAHHDVISRLCR